MDTLYASSLSIMTNGLCSRYSKPLMVNDWFVKRLLFEVSMVHEDTLVGVSSR